MPAASADEARAGTFDFRWKTATNVWGCCTKMFADACKSKVLDLRVRVDYRLVVVSLSTDPAVDAGKGRMPMHAYLRFYGRGIYRVVALRSTEILKIKDWGAVRLPWPRP